MNKYSLSALVAAGLLASATTSASAADLGGNCCADLEERIAELEATTARKGNRKVSLTVSGWVNQQITFWDDGRASDVYIHDLGSTLGSHVKFTGAATISPGWSAGYVLHIEALNSDGLTTDQNNAQGPALYNLLATNNALAHGSPSGLGGGLGGGRGVQVLQSYWFVKSESLGKVSVGLQSQASDNTAILVDGSGSLISANWVAFDVRGFGMRLANGAIKAGSFWGGAAGACGAMGGAWGDCNGLTQDVVRYDSPSFGGFSVSASWGADDMWDVAGRYAGEFGGFKLAAAAAYNEVKDNNYNSLGTLRTDAGNLVGALATDATYFQAGVYVEHVATGLFGLVNYGNHDNRVAGTGPNAETWYAKGGIRTKFSSLGHTVFYGEYLNGQDGGFAAGSELEVWGLGAVQEVDAAAMSVWLKYRNLSYSDNLFNGATAATSVEDFNYVGVGAIINF
jgi:Gram-negative porin